MIFVVLGMHKSGTTMLSKILHDSDIAMGDTFNDEITYEEGNKYERVSTWKFNEEVLDCEGQNSAIIKDRPDLQLTSAQQEKIKAIIETASNQEHWGFKDPRTCLTYPMWDEFLDEHKLLVIYRHPHASWHRYRSRKRIWKNPVEAYVFLRSWKMHNTSILDILDSTSQERLVFEYYAFNTDPACFEQLEQFVGRNLADSRFPEIRKHHYPAITLLRVVDKLQSMVGLDSIEKITTRMARHVSQGSTSA